MIAVHSNSWFTGADDADDQITKEIESSGK